MGCVCVAVFDVFLRVVICRMADLSEHALAKLRKKRAKLVLRDGQHYDELPDDDDATTAAATDDRDEEEEEDGNDKDDRRALRVAEVDEE